MMEASGEIGLAGGGGGGGGMGGMGFGGPGGLGKGLVGSLSALPTPGGAMGGGGGPASGGAGRGNMVRRASLGSQPTQDRWVCPNDRHLALRAKLKMGWSTSQPVPVTRQDSLSEAETKIILEVIQRAEKLDLVEQERIGRLVDRVEAMKHRAQGNGANNCILCGEGLPLLRTAATLCTDCRKRVCSKCGVESPSLTGEKVWLCKICAETREMWKRSGAWFFRGIPKHILPPAPNTSAGGGRRSRAPPRRANTIGVKGGSEVETDTSSEEETHRRQRLQKASSECAPHDVDGFPLPLSPNPRSRSVSPSPFRFDSTDSGGGGGGGGLTRESSDDRGSDKSPMSPGVSKRDLSRASSRESGGGGDVGGLLLTPYYSPSPHNLSPRSELRRDQAIDRSPSPLLRVAWRDSGRGSNSSVSDSPNLSRESREENDAEASAPGTPGGASVSAAGHDGAPTTALPSPAPRSPHPSPSPINRSSSSSSSGNLGQHSLSSPTVNGFRSRRESEASRSSEDKRHPRLGRNPGGSRDSRSSRDSRDSLVSRDSSMRDEVTSSSVDEVFTDERHVNSNNIQDQKEKEAMTGLGLVEFSLLYDSHNQALHCTVHSARNLRPADSGSQADPYVKLHLLPGASKSNKLRTRTIPKTVNPDFNETLTYYGISDQDMARKTLRLTILDEDRFSCDFLGEARIALKKVRPHETKRLRVNLEKRAILAEDEVKGETERGKVLLSLKYATQRNALIVGIVRCAHLPSMDSNGFSDPYVKVQLKPDPTHKKYRTAVKWKNLNPEFNEEFVFEVRRNELPKKLLDIRVYDKDVGRSDDFIGGLQLSQDSTGTELRHWYDALQYPDRRHDRWHQLQPLNGK
ncbi:rabphilin-3A-like [Penaeus indicus]|uniref:rabphilin-3A-like n=1 Tax=Penaeus indicus TaxID=29960 RepID=UPI00300D1989